ncbi:hypothetical protein BVN1_30990 [Bacillus velezensis]|nr:hypothetical protein BVN1_30990 [Bacillus velezensis]
MKQTIFEHERSPFNKRLLASKRTPEGHMVLSERNITIKKHDGTLILYEACRFSAKKRPPQGSRFLYVFISFL